jgi:hypothetical protein
MDLCFFTMANRKFLERARYLVSSGDAVDRPIWFYRIPDDNPDPKRYKIELLLRDDLPRADRYIYLDADNLMLKHGEWESDECVGVVPFTFKNRMRYVRRYFAPNDTAGFEAYYKLLEAYGFPAQVNSGCIVLPANIRKQVAERWMEWCKKIDSLCTERTPLRDQMHLAFVVKEMGLPFIPKKYNVCLKYERVGDDAVVIHAAGHAARSAMRPYNKAVTELLGGPLRGTPLTATGFCWQLLTHLIMQYARDPTYPIGAEVGILAGENAGHLLKSFPGLRLYCIDDWCTMPRVYEDWCRVKNQYIDRVIEIKGFSSGSMLNEQLDFVFLDANGTKEQVIQDINHWLPQVRFGGVIAGHDLDGRTSMGDVNGVRAAVTFVFGNNFNVGPDYMWWVVRE